MLDRDMKGVLRESNGTTANQIVLKVKKVPELDSEPGRAKSYERSGVDWQPKEGSLHKGSRKMTDAGKLSKPEVKDICRNCIKLAAECKINAQNSFSLELIEHMEDLVKDSDDGETNFQHASFTLDAGVQIYSYRVDAVHTDAFKTLQGLNRTSMQKAQECRGEESEGTGEDDKRGTESAKWSDPESTLEPFEALNMKKFDLAFSVDPLFHRTSAQFDAGGPQGLLLYNLGVLHGCSIVFDSQEKPEDLVALRGKPRQGCKVDVPLPLPTPVEGNGLGSATAELRRRLGDEFGTAAPSIAEGPRQIVDGAVRSAKAARLPHEAASDGTGQAPGPDEPAAEDSWEPESTFFTADEGSHIAAEGDGSVYFGMSEEIGQSRGDADEEAASAPTGDGPLSGADAGDHSLQKLLDCGFSNDMLGGIGWAGSSHWRYRAAVSAAKSASKDTEGSPQRSTATSDGSGRARARKAELDFTRLPLLPEDALAPAKKPASICLASSTLATKANTLLPEDHKYKARDLARLFLMPRSLYLRPGRTPAMHSRDAFGPADCCDENNDDFDSGGFDIGDLVAEEWNGGAGGDSDAIELAETARRVPRVEVNYSRVAKQVDVRALKAILWEGVSELKGNCLPGEGVPQSGQVSVSFGDLMAGLPKSSAAGPIEDLSVHLCFICALHLANEHGLEIHGPESLNALDIIVPAAR